MHPVRMSCALAGAVDEPESIAATRRHDTARLILTILSKFTQFCTTDNEQQTLAHKASIVAGPLMPNAKTTPKPFKRRCYKPYAHIGSSARWDSTKPKMQRRHEEFFALLLIQMGALSQLSKGGKHSVKGVPRPNQCLLRLGKLGHQLQRSVSLICINMHDMLPTCQNLGLMTHL